MTLEQLRIFVAVAEREHLTRAAEALRLTPSTVSAAVHALEDRYGVQLFHRVGRGIEITEPGRIFLAEAQATLGRARAAELALSEIGGLKRGELRIHASQTTAAYWLPRRIVRFRERHRAIELHLSVGNTETVARAVVEGGAELGFVEGDITEPALAMRTVDKDRLIVIVAPGHPWAGRKTVPTRKDILSIPWILRERGSGTRSVFESSLARRGIDPGALTVLLEMPSNEAVLSAVELGRNAAVMSELVAAAYLAARRVVRVPFEIPPRAFRLLRHKERYRTKASLAFERIACE